MSTTDPMSPEEMRALSILNHTDPEIWLDGIAHEKDEELPYMACIRELKEKPHAFNFYHGEAETAMGAIKAAVRSYEADKQKNLTTPRQ